MPDAPPEKVAHVVARRDEARREDEEVVEVERLRRAQRLLVRARDVREAGAQEVAEAAREVLRLDALVLGLRDARLDLPRRGRLLGQGDLLHRALQDGELVVRVEDDEALRHARLVRKAPEEAHAPRVKRPDERARPLGAEERADAVLHLARGLVRERDGDDGFLRHAVRHDPGEPARQDARLPRPRAREDEERPLAVRHGGGLFGVEAFEKIFRAGDQGGRW